MNYIANKRFTNIVVGKGIVLVAAILIIGCALCLIRPIPVWALTEFNADANVSLKDDFNDAEGEYKIAENVSINLNIDDTKTIEEITLSEGSILTITGTSGNKLTVGVIGGNSEKGKLIIKSGTIEIKYSIKASNVEINDGNVRVNGTYSVRAIDANSLKITGGTIYASANKNNYHGIGLCVNYGNIEISGGTITAIGENYGIEVLNGNITISGGNVTSTGGLGGIIGDNVTIKGDNTVVKAKCTDLTYQYAGAITSVSYVQQQDYGTVSVDAPLKIINPNGGAVSRNGWFIAKAEGSGETAKDVVIMAPHSITVTNDGHGTGSATPASAIDGTEIILSATHDEGYVFDKWTSDDGITFADSTSANTTFNMINKIVTVKANFKPGTPAGECTITFDPNGGKGEMNPQTEEKGKTVKLRANDFTRSGYEFKNWNTKADGSGDKYDNKQSVKLEEDLTLYAQWKEKNEDKDDDDDHEDEPAPKKEVKYPDGFDELRILLRNAAASGKEVTVSWNKGASLPYDVMKILQDNPKVTLVFSCTYLGNAYSFTIPGKSVIANPAIQWYGPLYLYPLYGNAKAPASLQNTTAATGTYTVKSGDTLRGIAIKYNTTVKHLQDVNNIKDPDKIKTGMVLKY